MRSSQKNLLYFLTGRIHERIKSTMELGPNIVCSSVILNRFTSTHKILFTEDCKDKIEKYGGNLEGFNEQYEIVQGDLESIAKQGIKSDLVVIHNNLWRFIQKDDLGSSLKSFVKNVILMRPRYVLIADDRGALERDLLVEYFNNAGYEMLSYGLIDKTYCKSKTEPKGDYLVGYLFYKGRVRYKNEKKV